MKEDEGIKQKTHLIHRHREKEGGDRWRWAKGGMGWKETAWSRGHTMQSADVILWSCTVETCRFCEPMSPQFN